jgi:RND family efflux transporter MFP subunit
MAGGLAKLEAPPCSPTTAPPRFDRVRASAAALGALVVLLLMAVSFSAGMLAGAPTSTMTSPRPTPTPTPTRAPTPSPSPSPQPGFEAQAVVVPERSAELAAPITAIVEQVLVEEGQEVRQGQLLVRLDTSTRRAQVTVAQADLRRAEAEVARAQVVIDQLPDDASQGQRDQAAANLRLAQAEVTLAQSMLDAARTALAQTELRAPWAGTVAELGAGAGEQAVAGQPLVALADMAGWLFETTDVTELDVVRVAVGDRVTIQLPALPDLELEGVVDQVRVRGGSGDGGVRFDVVVRPLEHVEQLRWNMSAILRIVPGRPST